MPPPRRLVRRGAAGVHGRGHIGAAPPSPVADGRRASRHSNHRSGALFRRRRRGVAAAPASRERLSARPRAFPAKHAPDLDLEGGNRSVPGNAVNRGRSERVSIRPEPNSPDARRARLGAAAPPDASVRAAKTPPSNRAIGRNQLQSAWPIPSPSSQRYRSTGPWPRNACKLRARRRRPHAKPGTKQSRPN